MREMMLGLCLVILIRGTLAGDVPQHSLATLAETKSGRAMRASSSDPNWNHGNGDARPIKPGESLVIADLDGPGVINHIWFTIMADAGFPRYVSLRFYWDNESFPSVLSPLGDFFAVGNGMTANVDSAVVEVSSDGRAYNCYWPMPFRKHARLEVRNDSADKNVGALYWYVDWIKTGRLSRSTPYFHAHYRQEYPAVAGQNYLFLETKGRGHYAGTVYSVIHTENGWFGEGDDFFFIDGETEPSLRGTGTEDYFCDAWGFREFNQPNHGVTVWEGGETGARGTAYRWHLRDPVPFAKSLRVEIEHWGSRHNADGSAVSGFIERADLLSSVAFWYQREPSPAMEPLPPVETRLLQSKVIEAETLLDHARIVNAATMVQPLGNCSGGHQVLLISSVQDVTAEFTFEVEKAGRYVFELALVRSWDYGTYRISLDGVVLAPSVNLFAPTVQHKSHRFGSRQLSAGPHLLRFECVSADSRSQILGAASPGYYLGFDAIVLTEL